MRRPVCKHAVLTSPAVIRAQKVNGRGASGAYEDGGKKADKNRNVQTFTRATSPSTLLPTQLRLRGCIRGSANATVSVPEAM